MMLKIAVVLLVLALVSGSEAKRGQGRRRGQRPAGGRTRGLPPTAQLVSSWQRTLVDATARELAYTLPDQDDQLYVLSKDVRQLKRNDYKPSKTLYDFTGGTSVVVMKVKKLRGCVLLNKPTDLTKAGVTADLEALNGTTVAASTPVTMYLSNDALQPAQATDMQARTAVRAMCGRKPIRPATDIMPQSMEGATTVLTTTLGEQLSITATGGQGRQRGGRGGSTGRRGGGRRRNNSPGGA